MFKPCRWGISLVEVLVAISIIGLLLALIFRAPAWLFQLVIVAALVIAIKELRALVPSAGWWLALAVACSAHKDGDQVFCSTQVPCAGSLACDLAHGRCVPADQLADCPTHGADDALAPGLSWVVIADRSVPALADCEHTRQPGVDLDAVLLYRTCTDAFPSEVPRCACSAVGGPGHRCVIAVGKHFPGLGRVTADTHLNSATLGVPKAELEAQEELVPARVHRRRVALPRGMHLLDVLRAPRVDGAAGEGEWRVRG